MGATWLVRVNDPRSAVMRAVATFTLAIFRFFLFKRRRPAADVLIADAATEYVVFSN